MTDALVEAVALATLRSEYGLPEATPDGMVIAMHRHRNNATAALQAIEAAGYRVVPVEATPAAWMRRWAYDKNEGTKGNRPKGWHLHAVTEIECLDDDVPLFAAPRMGEGAPYSANVKRVSEQWRAMISAVPQAGEEAPNGALGASHDPSYWKR